MAHHQDPHSHPSHEPVDAWHRHTPEEGQPQEEHGARANTPILAGALLATLVFLVVVITVIFMYFESFTTRLRAERLETTELSARYRQYKLQVAEDLATYSVLPPAVAPQGVVTIPLEEAKQRVMARYQQGGSSPQ